MVKFKTKTGKIVSFIAKSAKKIRTGLKRRTKKQMPRKRRSRSRGSYFGRRSRHSRHSSGMNPMQLVLAGGAYGAARESIINLIQPIASKLPTQYGTSAILGVGGYLLAKKTNGLIKNIGLAMLAVEAANIGHNVMGINIMSQQQAPNIGAFV